ncbi:MAG: methyltransferase [Bacteroidales bacterium]|nr:methyltransferase [Bacteroidales bacterium]
MPNNWFRFKQFTIYQDRTAMKVGTDGVLLGAWTETKNAEKILDIGTGTGLIALMLAQRSEAHIEAIEIDEGAAGQAAENISSSPFSGRINLTHTSLAKFLEETNEKFDLIVCNPPFFKNSLHPPSDSRAIARHSKELGLDELFSSVHNLLKEEGRFCMIYPFSGKEEVIQIAARENLFPVKITNVKPSELKNPIRVLVEFSSKSLNTTVNNLAIETAVRHEFTREYTELTRDFYPGIK